MPHLVIENGPERGKRVHLVEDAPCVFGSAEHADLRADDHLLSPEHFEVRFRDGLWFLRDLGSRNGTFVNEDPVVDEVSLGPGDGILAGETQISFTSDEAASRRGMRGKMVAGYRIIERLGRGGMGTVFRAEQVSLGREVALKVLSPRWAQDPSFVERFQREARAAGQLNHPNIVQVYDVGHDKDVHFYSMEYIANGSVQDRIEQEGALDVELALTIVMDAARGLEYAEKRGLVHRDIKPDNLMINEDGVIKIADLGLARMEQEGHEDQGIFGTPHFVAPEQAQGLAVDSRTDIYSLGATFYYLLCGRTPFDGESVREILDAQVNLDPEPPARVGKGVPTAVSDLCLRMMAKDPAERPQNAPELLAQLERAGQAAPKRKLLLLAGVVLLLLVGLGAALAGAFGDEKPAPPPPGPEQPTPPVVSPPDPGPTDPNDQEKDRREALLAARERNLQLRQERLELPENAPPEVLRALAARWRKEVLEPWPALAAEAPPDEAFATARAQIAELETAAAKAEAKRREDAEAEKEAEALVATALEASRAAAEEDAFGEALAPLLDALADQRVLGRAAASRLETELKALRERAGRRGDAAIARAREQMERGEWDAARKGLATLAAKMERGLTSVPQAAPIREVAEALRQEARAVDDRRAESLAQDLLFDEKSVRPPRREALLLARSGMVPERALEALKRAPEAKSPEWAAWMAEDRADLEAQLTVKRAVREHRPAEPIRVEMPEGRRLWSGASDEGIALGKRRGDASVTPWAELSPGTIDAVFVADRSLGVPLEARVRSLLVGGDEGAAQALVEKEGRITLPADLRARVAREAAARRALDEIRALEEAAPKDRVAARQLVQRLEAFFKEHRRTRVMLVASNGRTRLVEPGQR